MSDEIEERFQKMQDEKIKKQKEKVEAQKENEEKIYNTQHNTKTNTQSNTTSNTSNNITDNTKNNTKNNTKENTILNVDNEVLETIKAKSNKGPDKVRINAYLEKEILKQFDSIAEREDISRSELLNISMRLLIKQLR